jgi:iron-sulfur cluster assembly accessory protein
MSRIKNIVNLTEKAVTQLRKIEKPEHVLQFSLKGGGCAGMKQELKYVPKDKLDKYDEIVKIKDKKGDLEVAVDKLSVMKLMDSTIDYEDTLISSGFTINNPNVKLKCGCGESVLFD